MSNKLERPAGTIDCKRCGVVVVDTIDGVCDPCFDNHNEEKSNWPSPVVAFQEGLREGAEKEREAIVKWLRDGDRSCDCCGLTREVNHIEGSPIDFDQLCPECHFTKRHIAKSIEDGDHL